MGCAKIIWNFDETRWSSGLICQYFCWWTIIYFLFAVVDFYPNKFSASASQQMACGHTYPSSQLPQGGRHNYPSVRHTYRRQTFHLNSRDTYPWSRLPFLNPDIPTPTKYLIISWHTYPRSNFSRHTYPTFFSKYARIDTSTTNTEHIYPIKKTNRDLTILQLGCRAASGYIRLYTSNSL